MTHGASPNPRARRGLTVAALLCLLPAASWPAAASAASPAPAGTAVLLDPGVEPREPLRYRIETGRTVLMTVDSTQSVSVEAGGSSQSIDVPTTRFVAEVVTSAAEPEGAVRLDFRYLGAGLAEPGDPQMGAAMQEAFAPMLGLHGWSVLDDQGRVLDVGFEGVETLDPALASSFSDFERLGSEMSAPFPAEPVGIGARWQVLQEVPAQGLLLEQTVEYTLLERTDDGVTLSVDISSTAEPGPFAPPGLPIGTEAELVALGATASGAMALALEAPVPTSSVEMEMRMDLRVNGMPMTMDITADAEIRPGADQVWPSSPPSSDG